MTLKGQVFALLEREWDVLQDRFSVRRIGIFGSCLRNEAKADSDVDILVEFDERPLITTRASSSSSKTAWAGP